MNRKIVQTCPVCGKAYDDYEKLQIHVFTECAIGDERPKVSSDDMKVSANGSPKPCGVGVRKFNTLSAALPSPSDAKTPLAIVKDNKTPKAIDSAKLGITVDDDDVVGTAGADETYDNPEEKTVYVDEAEELLRVKGGGGGGNMGRKPAPDDRVRFFFSHIWESDTCDVSYGGGSKGVTICLEAAVHMLHDRMITVDAIDEIIRTGCFIHPHPGPMQFQEVYRVHRYQTQLIVLDQRRYSTQNHTHLIDVLPQFIKESKSRPLCVLITGATAGSILLYMGHDRLYVFDPQTRVNEDTNDKSPGAAIMQFDTLQFLESYLLMLLQYVAIEDEQQDELFNSYDMISVALKPHAKYERVLGEVSPAHNNDNDKKQGEISPSNSLDFEKLPENPTVPNLLAYIDRMKVYHAHEITLLKKRLEKERSDKAELLAAIKAEVES